MKPALIVIDVQNAFFKISPETAKSLDSAIEYINAAIDLFRQKELPIIAVQHIDEDDKLIPGQYGFELPESLKIKPIDKVFHKTYGNSFNKTELQKTLNDMGVDTVIITGFCAEYCVLSTYRGAQDLDFTPIILRNSIASIKPEHIGFVENINDVISFGALKKLI